MCRKRVATRRSLVVSSIQHDDVEFTLGLSLAGEEEGTEHFRDL